MKRYFDQIKNENPQLILELYDHCTALMEDFEKADQYENRDYYTKIDEFSRLLKEILNILPVEGIQLSLFEELDEENEKDFLTLSDDFTYTKPKGYTFIENKYKEANSFKELYIEILQELCRMDPLLFYSVEKKARYNGIKKPYFSKDSSKLQKPVKIGKLYAETHFNTIQIRNLLIKFMKLFELEEDQLKIYIRLDHKKKYRYYG